VQKLEGLGVRFLRPEAGNLACGEVGEGRLMEPEEILGALLA
jgi:phosphopantothenoylcysteine synthetase/decarboxylase